ncbi:MAG: glycosyltransferase [Pseudolabrys sp.]
MIVANFMDSSLVDLQAKGVFSSVPQTYNPGDAYDRVIHFSPHARDLSISPALREHRIELVVHPLSGLSPLKFVCTLAMLWRLFGRERIDIVRGRLPYLGSLVGGLAARLRGIPFVVSLGGDNRMPQERNNTFYYNSRFLSYGMEKLVLLLANRVIVPNRFTQAYVESIVGVRRAAARCVVIPWQSEPVNATGSDDAVLLAPLGLPTDAAIVPIVGFINRYKYSDVLFQMLAKAPLVLPDGRPVVFCFAGDGPLRVEALDRFKDRSEVRLPGGRPPPIVAAPVRRAAAVVIPMSGFVLLEAASLGKPVVTSSVEWHEELVQDGKTGLLVAPESAEAWRAAIVRLLSSPQEARAMGERLLAAYGRDYAPEACVAAEHRLYETLTGKRISA